MTAHAFYFSWRNEQACYDSLLLFGGASFRPSLDPDGLALERVIFPMNLLPVYSFFFYLIVASVPIIATDTTCIF